MSVCAPHQAACANSPFARTLTEKKARQEGRGGLHPDKTRHTASSTEAATGQDRYRSRSLAKLATLMCAHFDQHSSIGSSSPSSPRPRPHTLDAHGPHRSTNLKPRTRDIRTHTTEARRSVKPTHTTLIAKYHAGTPARDTRAQQSSCSRQAAGAARENRRRPLPSTGPSGTIVDTRDMRSRGAG